MAITSQPIYGQEIDVLIALIDPFPFQGREEFDEADIEDLAGTIKDEGLLQAIILRPKADGRFEVVAGERRLRACKRLGWTTIKCKVFPYSDLQASVVNAIENFQRKELNPIEKAKQVQGFLTRHDLTLEQVSKHLGVGIATLRNLLKLLELDPEVQRSIARGELKPTIGLEIGRRISDPDNQRRAASIAVTGKLSRDQLVARTQHFQDHPSSETPARTLGATLAVGELSKALTLCHANLVIVRLPESIDRGQAEALVRQIERLRAELDRLHGLLTSALERVS